MLKKESSVENGKIALVRASVVVTDYIELFCMGADRHNGILTSLLLLVAETIINCSNKTGNLPAARFPML